jgi:hypothetical protein
VSVAHAVASAQQLDFVHAVHASSPATAGHEAPLELLEEAAPPPGPVPAVELPPHPAAAKSPRM